MKRKFIFSHLAAFACGVLLVCGVSMGVPHRVSSGVYGDVNGDGVVDVDDLNEVVNVMLGKPHGGERAILVSEESLTFTGEVDGVYTQTLTLGGDNLHGAVAKVEGDGAFTVSHGELSLEQVQQGAELAVTYAPLSAGTHTARLLLTSDGAPNVTVSLTGTATQSGAFTSKTYIVDGERFRMVAVEGGTFTMGATAEQGTTYPESNEYPTHQVTLSNYMIGETEVTQALWQAVMHNNPSDWGDVEGPVECVSWNDCQEFIAKLNELTGETFRLPTEAEWEFAARGGNKSQGWMYAGHELIYHVAWYKGNAYDVGEISPDYGVHPVAMKSPNELGLYDMSGNVWEWCQDWYGSYSSEAQTNPQGPSSGTKRVYRGGAWGENASNCRTSTRRAGSPTLYFNALGLRLALE